MSEKVAERDSDQLSPKVFLSYSWESDVHRGWVEGLAARLRNCGVETVLDKWNLEPGDQLPYFMETSIRESLFVLCVCTPAYKAKFDGRRGGVGFEANLISGEALAVGNERKFIGLHRSGEWTEAAPAWLLGKRALDFLGDRYPEASFEELVSTLHGVRSRGPVVRGGISLDSSELSKPESLARQGVYAKMMVAAFDSIKYGEQKLMLLEKSNSATKILLPGVQANLDKSGELVKQLMMEVDLLSSEPVRIAAGQVAGHVLAAQITSMVPKLKPDFEAVRKRMLEELMPKFRDAIRLEQGLVRSR